MESVLWKVAPWRGIEKSKDAPQLHYSRPAFFSSLHILLFNYHSSKSDLVLKISECARVCAYVYVFGSCVCTCVRNS